MTALLEAIDDLIRPSLKLTGSLIQLEEAARGSTYKPVTLTRSEPAVVLKLDVPRRVCPRPDCGLTLTANDRMFPLFRVEKEGLTSVCDYIIFCQEQAPNGSVTYYALLCELKSTNEGHAKKQIENGAVLVDYVVAMAQHHSVVAARQSVEKRGIIFMSGPKPPMGDRRTNRCQYSPCTSRVVKRIARYSDGQRYPLVHFCN